MIPRRTLAGRAGPAGGCFATALVLTMALAGPAAPSSTHPAAAPPTQELAVLDLAKLAQLHPDGSSKLLTLISPRRPITGEQTALPVVGHATDRRGVSWLEVRLPGRPNGWLGWITARSTTRVNTPWRIVVALSTRQVTAWSGGRLAATYTAIVGKRTTPTPIGSFFVEETVALTRGDVGAPDALALSARSSVLQEFAGGPGQIALHGLNNVGGVLGTAVSHGCIRLSTPAITWLAARIGPGTPVDITR